METKNWIHEKFNWKISRISHARYGITMDCITMDLKVDDQFFFFLCNILPSGKVNGAIFNISSN